MNATYLGYLAPYLDRIRELHGCGATSREIAKALYAAGARAGTSDPDPNFRMTRDHHIANLRMMVVHVLNRLGLPGDHARHEDDRGPFMLARRDKGATYREIGAEFGVSMERARQLVLRAQHKRDRPHWRNQLTTRAVNALCNAIGMRLLDLPEAEAAAVVARLDQRELLATPNLGKTSLHELDVWLARFGLKLSRRPTIQGTINDEVIAEAD
jgi:hypothetical protein